MHRFGRCRAARLFQDLDLDAGNILQAFCQFGDDQITVQFGAVLARFPGDDFDLHLANRVQRRLRPGCVGVQPAITGKGERAGNAGVGQNALFDQPHQGVFFAQR